MYWQVFKDKITKTKQKLYFVSVSRRIGFLNLVFICHLVLVFCPKDSFGEILEMPNIYPEENNFGLQIYPNPANEYFTLRIPNFTKYESL